MTLQEKKDRYQKRMAYIAAHKTLQRMLHIGNQVLTAIIFGAYVLLLVDLFLQRSTLLAKAIIVPLDSFIIVSVFRCLLNRQRPYELYETPPAIRKQTKGKSFPSRHVFSVFVIAMTCLAAASHMWYGVVLLGIGLGIAVIRVVSGVHYLSDVIAGALIGMVSGMLGFW